MDAVKQRCGIVKAVSKKDRPAYIYYIMRQGSAPLGPVCEICPLYNRVGVVQPPEKTTASGLQYQLCNSNLHQFYWNSPSPNVSLPGRPAAQAAPADPWSRTCSNGDCKKRPAGQCSSRRCLQCCVGHARNEYQRGLDPLKMCAAHSKTIQELVVGFLRAEEQGAPQPDNGAEGDYDGLEDNIVPQEPEPEQPVLVPQPAQREPVRVLRNPPQRLNIQQAPVRAGQRGALAVPVAPLPLALAIADRNVYQGGEPRVQRQVAVQNLTRLSREDTAASLERRLKVTMWRTAGKCRTEIILNTKTSRDAFTLSDHPTIVSYLKSGDGSPLQIEIYDWEEKEWLVSSPDIPHPLFGHKRVLIRGLLLTDDDCEELADCLAKDETEENGPNLDGNTAKKRKRVEAPKRSKGKSVIVKSEKATSPPVTSFESPPPLSSSPPPIPPPAKRRRLNANARSWIMRETYQFVSNRLEKVWKYKAKGYEAVDAVNRSFHGKKPLARSTWQRHDKLYYFVPEDKREEWARDHADRLWAEFWVEFAGLLKGEEGFDVDDGVLGDAEGEMSQSDEGDETEEDGGQETQEPSSDVPIKIEDATEVDLSMGKGKGKARPDDAENSPILPHPGSPTPLDVKPKVSNVGASSSRSHFGTWTQKERRITPDTVIDLSSGPESDSPTSDSGSAKNEAIIISD